MPEYFEEIDLFFILTAAAGAAVSLVKLFLRVMKKTPDLRKDPDRNIDLLISGINLNIISFNAFAAFLFLFGFMSFALHRYSNAGILFSVSCAIAVAAVSVFLLLKLIGIMLELQFNTDKMTAHCSRSEQNSQDPASKSFPPVEEE